MIPNLFTSPFNGEFLYSQSAILMCLRIRKIENQPIMSATVTYRLGTDTIEAGRGKYYGLAFFHYCLTTYGTNEEMRTKCFKVTFPMVVEAMLYYGAALWSDDTHSHPSITPFRVAAQNVTDITVQLTYEPHH